MGNILREFPLLPGTSISSGVNKKAAPKKEQQQVLPQQQHWQGVLMPAAWGWAVLGIN